MVFYLVVGVEGPTPFSIDELIGDVQRLIVSSYLDLPTSICFGMTCKRFHRLVLTDFEFMDILDLRNEVSCALGRSGSVGVAAELILAGWFLSLQKILKHAIIHNQMAAVERFSFVKDTILFRFKGIQITATSIFSTDFSIFEMVSEWFGRSGNLDAATNFRLGQGRTLNPLDESYVTRGMIRQGHMQLLLDRPVDRKRVSDAARYDRLDYLIFVLSFMGNAAPALLVNSVETYPYPDLLGYLIQKKFEYSFEEVFRGAVNRINSGELESLNILQIQNPSLFQSILPSALSSFGLSFSFLKGKFRLIGKIITKLSREQLTEVVVDELFHYCFFAVHRKKLRMEVENDIMFLFDIVFRQLHRLPSSEIGKQSIKFEHRLNEANDIYISSNDVGFRMVTTLLQSPSLGASHFPIVSAILHYASRFRSQKNDQTGDTGGNPSMARILKVCTILLEQRFSYLHEQLLSILLNVYGPDSFAIINAIGLEKFVVSPFDLVELLQKHFGLLDHLKIDQAEYYRVEFMDRYLPVMQWVLQTLEKTVMTNLKQTVMDETLPALLILTPRQHLNLWSPVLSHSLTTAAIQRFFEVAKRFPDLDREGVMERLKVCLEALMPSSPMIYGFAFETSFKRTEWTDFIDLLAAETFVSLGFTSDEEHLAYLLGRDLSPAVISIFLKHRRAKGLSDVLFYEAVAANNIIFVGLLIDNGFEMKSEHVKKLIEHTGAALNSKSRVSVSVERADDFTGLPPWAGITPQGTLKKYATSANTNTVQRGERRLTEESGSDEFQSSESDDFDISDFGSDF